MEDSPKLKVVIITGMSGAGKTNAVDWFEDQDYYCIDNMPPSLIKNFLELTTSVKSSIERAAFVVDIRSEEFFKDLNDTLSYLAGNSAIEYSILFIEASDAVLIRRFSETRRNHPLANGSTTAEVLQQERNMLADIKKKADNVIDTTNMKVSDFKNEMSRIFTAGGEGKAKFALNVQSFGYKYGIPDEADIVIDMRFLPNPFYVKSLKKLTGNSRKVSHYVLKTEAAKVFIDQLKAMLDMMVPNFIEQGKYHLNLALGCTGGQHRSVAMANELARVFEEMGYRVSLEHREL